MVPYLHAEEEAVHEPLTKAREALEQIEAIAGATLKPPNADAIATAALRIAEVNAAVAIAESLDRIADVLDNPDSDGRVRVEVVGSLTSYSVEP